MVLALARESLISSSGGLLLQRTIRLAGLDRALSAGLVRWRSPRSKHDPGKVLLDLTTAVALGGDCAADLAVVRAQHEVFGLVASDATVSRLIGALAVDIDVALPAIRAAHAAARQRVWTRRRPLAGTPDRREGGLVVVDIDSTIVSATPTSRVRNQPITHLRVRADVRVRRQP